MSFIDVNHLSKTFKVAKRNSGLKAALKSFVNRKYVSIDAVKDVSFKINKGEIVGYIGPNGAGKSTTIKMLCGILKPDSGSISINHMSPFEERKKFVKDIGVVFGQRSQLWWDIPAEDTFDLLKVIYKIDDKEYLETKNKLVEMLDIKDVIKMPVRQLSLGQRMRCEIAASLLHKPSILFLDEPTIGLDAVSKEKVRNFIIEINKKYKTTVILTSHDMNDIEALANRIILIGRGSKLFDGTLNDLKAKFGNCRKVTIITNDTLKKFNKKGVCKRTKTDIGYEFIIDINLISISSFVNYVGEYVDISDIDIDSDNIDNLIIKLYQEYNI